MLQQYGEHSITKKNVLVPMITRVCILQQVPLMQSGSRILNFCHPTLPYSPDLALSDYHRFLPLEEA